MCFQKVSLSALANFDGRKCAFVGLRPCSFPRIILKEGTLITQRFFRYLNLIHSVGAWTWIYLSQNSQNHLLEFSMKILLRGSTEAQDSDRSSHYCTFCIFKIVNSRS